MAELNRQKELFLAALDLPSAHERAAFLAETCGPDEALRRQVEAMLRAHAAPDSFLEKPAAHFLDAGALTVAAYGNADSMRPPGEGAGTQIGPYKLLEKIGEGGMGVVYMAEQQAPIRRTVALKIIKPGMGSGQVLARFEAERQALALMDHPNIAHVLDAGATTDGRPFFVMELVKGTPITKFCDERRLPARQRLELFVSVCLAIQHAHQKGVIHRDIKPSNVLVALYDDRPVPKVIDFGVAKAAGQPLTEMTLHTGYGAIVGTPEYMSPEQATFNQLDIDTRSDVYALGVLLYELLTGTTPVLKTRFKEAALMEMLRVVREEEPPRPSFRLSTSQAKASIAETRGIGPEQLAQLLRGELDWIVMKALEKERNRRYESAAGLARDVDRYLKDEMVDARPPSLAYRLRKTVSRNRGLVIAASLVLLALVGGVIGTTIGMLWARDAASRAHIAEEDARAQGRIARAEADEAKKARDDARRLAALEETARKREEENAREAKFQALRADTSRHANQMETILREWQRDDLETATQVLDEVPEAYRETLECRLLRDLCRRRARPVLLPAPNGWFSLDGKTVVILNVLETVAAPTELAKWRVTVNDVATGRERLSVTGELGLTYPRVVFDKDAKRIALACVRKADDKGPGRYCLEVWDVDKRAKLWSVESERAYVDNFLSGAGDFFSPDGKRLATPHLGGFAVRDAATGTLLYQIKEATSGRLVVFSPDGKHLAGVLGTYAPKCPLKIYDAANGKEKLFIEAGKEYAVFRIAFSPDGKGLLAHGKGGGHTSFFELFDVETGARKLATKYEPTGTHTGLCDAGFLADSKAIVIVTGVHDVTVVDIASGERRPVVGPLGPTICNRLDPDGRWVRGVSYGNKFALEWSVGKMPPASRTLKLAGHPHQVYASQISRDGAQVYILLGLEFQRYDVKTGEKLRSVAMRPTDFRGFPHQLMTLGASADGKWAAYRDTTNPNLIRLFDAASGEQVLKVKHAPPPSWSNFFVFAAFSPDSKRLVALGADRAIEIWNLNSRKIELSIPMDDTIRFLTHGPGDQIAAVAAGHVIVWDARTGKKLAALAQKDCQDVVFFSDGKRLLVRSAVGVGFQLPVLKVWDISTGKEVGQLQFEAAPGNVNHYDPMLLNPDGTRLLMGKRIWDVATGQIVLFLPVLHGRALAISHDGRNILALRDEPPNGIELVFFEAR